VVEDTVDEVMGTDVVDDEVVEDTQVDEVMGTDVVDDDIIVGESQQQKDIIYNP